jgi:dolichol-phosphate mannosyltransferase
VQQKTLMKIAVIIPTYNEAEAIGPLLDALHRQYAAIPGHEFTTLVVDANSPDQTAIIVRGLQQKYPDIDLLLEPYRRGLGAAYIAGMNYALTNLNPDAIMEFDGDGQHDPADIKKLVAAFDEGHDYVIGSRYVPGGVIPREWGSCQRLLSKYGSWVVRNVLALPVCDATSGFKLARVENFVERVPLSEDVILSRLHAYKIHLLYLMHQLGAKTIEIPITFRERRNGSSKSTILDIFESLKVVGILRLRQLIG